jgi:hypothetical protein
LTELHCLYSVWFLLIGFQLINPFLCVQNE